MPVLDRHILANAHLYANLGYVGVVVSALLEHIKRLESIVEKEAPK